MKFKEMKLLSMNLRFFGEDDDQTDTGAEDKADNSADGADDKGEDIQKKIDTAVQAALNAERAKQRIDNKKQAKTEPVKDPMAEVNEQLTKLQERTIKAEVKAALLSKDVDPAKIERAYKNVDLNDCIEDGELDEGKLLKQIDEILSDLPSLKKQTQQPDEEKGFKIGAKPAEQKKITEPTTAIEKIADKTQKLFKI